MFQKNKINLNQRSTEKELIDLGQDYYTPEEYKHCLKMLFRVNKWFGIFRRTRMILKSFSNSSSVIDIGCGGGLFLLNLSRYFPHMKLKGVDISKPAIELANQELNKFKATNVVFQLQNQAELGFAQNSVDILLATLMCHHLTDDELITFFKNAYAAANRAIIINDLHRHSIAMLLYRFFSPLLFKNRLITHDGLISIRRGFRKQEWRNLFARAGISNYHIKWRFPFVWSIVIWKK